MKLTGNTILVTGGTSGIGRALAEALHDRGNHVIIAGRRQKLLDDVVAARPGMTGIRLDLADPTWVRHLAGELHARFPALNVLVANAGISSQEDLTGAWDLSVSEAMVDTNILGILRLAAALLPGLACQPDAVIMATTSNLAFVPRTSFPTYCATKAFLHSWLQSLRHQLRGSVEVLELAPPYVQTELSGSHQVSDPRAMGLDDYVAEVLHLLEAQDHPAGEVLVERARDTRLAERDGRYDAVFAAMNPG